MLTLLIPTRNRAEFLIRTLNYYAERQCPFRILIGDSSEPEQLDRIQSYLASRPGGLNVEWHAWPELNVAECFERLSESVHTPYAVLTGDDDYLVPSSLRRCVDFLERHPDYSGAHGLGAMFTLDRKGVYGRINWVGPCLNGASIEAGTAGGRLMQFARAPFTPIFTVYRMECWKRMYRGNSRITDVRYSTEALPSWLAVAQGKVKEIDGLFLLRQRHADNRPVPDTYDWITSPGWRESQRIFSERLSQELVRQGYDPAEATEAVKKAYWRNLAWVMSIKWEAIYGNRRPRQSPLMTALWKVPGVRHLVRSVRFAATRGIALLNLPALLNPRSPYHADFMEICASLSGPPPSLKAPGGPNTESDVAFKFGSLESNISYIVQ